MATSNRSRKVMIGDYADVNDGEAIYRYYIIKIQSKQSLSIAQIDNNEIRTLILIDDIEGIKESGIAGGVWQLEGYEIPHTVSFASNSTNTKYFVRDLTQAPNNIIVIRMRKNGRLTGNKEENFIELQNGIILYQPEYLKAKTQSEGDKNIKRLIFADPSNIRMVSDNIHVNINYIEALTVAEIPVKYNFQVLKFNEDNINEIFLYSRGNQSIIELNLDKLTLTKYDKDIYLDLYPLRDEKVFLHTAG